MIISLKSRWRRNARDWIQRWSESWQSGNWRCVITTWPHVITTWPDVKGETIRDCPGLRPHNFIRDVSRTWRSSFDRNVVHDFGAVVVVAAAAVVTSAASLYCYSYNYCFSCPCCTVACLSLPCCYPRCSVSTYALHHLQQPPFFPFSLTSPSARNSCSTSHYTILAFPHNFSNNLTF